jgi:hypothetical protein
VQIFEKLYTHKSWKKKFSKKLLFRAPKIRIFEKSRLCLRTRKNKKNLPWKTKFIITASSSGFKGIIYDYFLALQQIFLLTFSDLEIRQIGDKMKLLAADGFEKLIKKKL